MHTGLRPPPSYRPLPHCHAWASSRRTQAYTGGEGKGPNGGGSSPAWALAGGQRRHLVLSDSPGGSTSAGGAASPLLQAGGSANGSSAGHRCSCHEVIGRAWGRLGGVARRRAGWELPKNLRQRTGRGAANEGGRRGRFSQWGRGRSAAAWAGLERCRRRPRCSCSLAVSGCGPGSCCRDNVPETAGRPGPALRPSRRWQPAGGRSV